MAETKTFVVKIQQSLAGNNGKRMLAYNKDRSISFEDTLSKEVKELLNGRPKAYFNAAIVNTKIELYDEVTTPQDF